MTDEEITEEFPIYGKTLMFYQTRYSGWKFQIKWIAHSRAFHYMDEFGNDLTRSLLEDTLPLFTEDPAEIRHWAFGNMDWEDVKNYATPFMTKAPDTMIKDWVNPYKTEIV
jgi:hypothetical protein